MSAGSFSGGLLGRRDEPEPGGRRHRAGRFLLWTALVVFVLFLVAIGGVSWYSTTPAFENKVRGILISTLEDSVGGRVELGSVRWHLLHLDFEVDNLTIHGLEAANEVPYAHLDKLHVRVKIISLFRAKVGLNYLGVDRPVVHLIVYKDGSTNQPVPRKRSAPSNTTDTINQIFDLAVDRTEINNGTALFNQQGDQKTMPFNLAANDLALLVSYVPARDHYTGTLSLADITAQRGIGAPIRSKLDVQADVGRNELDISSLTFNAGASTLVAHAHVANFNDPHWQLSAKGTVDLREAEALAAVPGLDSGVVALDLQGQGTKALFLVDGETRLGGVSYRASGINLRGLNAATKVHITQDELSLTTLVAHIVPAGTVDGEAHVYNWLSPATAPTSARDATPPAPGSKAAAIAKAGQQLNQAAAEATANPQAKSQPSRGVVKLRLSGFTLPAVLSIIAPPKFQNLGFFTTAAGTVELNWVGNPSDLAAEAKIALSAPAQPAHGDVPVNGAVNVGYSGRENSLLVRHFDVHTPGSQLQATGGVGLAAGRGSSLKAAASVTDLGEFNRALIAFGVGANGKKGTESLPVQLHGQAQFDGTVTGNLAAPDVKGHLSVNNFDVALNQSSSGTPAAQAVSAVANAGLPAASSQPTLGHGCSVPAGAAPGTVVSCVDPTGRQVPIQVASPAPDSPATLPPGTVPGAAAKPPAPGTAAAAAAPQTIHFDSLTANAEYSPEQISVQSALLVRGNTKVQLSGQLQAHHLSRHRVAFDDHSAVTADANIDKAALTDLLALGGQSLAVTGTLTLHTHVGGTLNNLSGGGHLNVAGGQIYGEPYKSLDADLVYAGRDITAANLLFLEDGGRVTGDGGFNLASNQFHFKAQGSGFDLAHFKSIKTAPLAIAGQLNFNAEGSGTATAPVVQADAHLINLSLSNPAGGPPSTGAVDLTARTQAGKLLLQVDARLNGATAKVEGTTALSGQYQTQAKLTLANLDLNPYLQLLNVQGVTAHSQIAGTVTLEGPLGTPKLLNGTAQLTPLEVVAQGIPLSTSGGLRASLRDGTLSIDQLHVTGGGTDLRAGGTAELFGTARALDIKADGSIDLKIVHSLVADATSSGAITLGLNIGGTIERPDLEGKVDFNNVNLAYASVPNGLSSMNGSLVFDQGRLQVRDLTATSGGGQVVFGGFVTYQQGVYADLSVNGKGVRVRYAGGISTLLDTKIRLQGTLANILVSGGVTINRFSVGPNLDLSGFSSNGISPPPDPDAFGNRIRLDIHVNSAPQLDINNSYAKLAGDINLNIRGTAADPNVLGHISITEGEATFAGTHYSLQHGDIYFTNPIRIEPTIDLEASAHIEDYDVLIGLHGTPDKLAPTFRSEPPLSEQDIFALLSVGRTQEEQQIYSNQQQQAGVNSTADSLLGGALNATVSSRINKLFGGGSVKIDPTFVSGTGYSTARITVQQQISKNGTVTYATNINSTNQQLIQGQINVTPQISLIAVRDEFGVFSVLVKLHQRYR